MRHNRLQHALTLILSIIFLSACNLNNEGANSNAQDNSSSKDQKEKYKIGVVAPLTGEGATYGASMKRGFDLAFKDEPDFKLLYEDSKFDSKLAVTILQRYISVDKVKIIYGEAASGVSLAMVPVSDRNKVIQFSSISSSDELQKSSVYFFRNVPRNNIQGKTAAEYVYENLNIQETAVLKDNDDYGINLANSFTETYRNLGGKVTLEESYNSGDKNFRNQLIKIKNSGAKAVFIPGNYLESGLILKQAKELGLNTTFIGGDGSYSPKLTEIAGNGANNFICTIMGVDTTNSFYRDFAMQFQKEYNQKPDVYDAYAYEAGTILKKAVEESGYDPEKVRDYLLNHSFTSLTGKLNFDEDGEVIRDYNLVKVQDDDFIYLNTNE